MRVRGGLNSITEGNWVGEGRHALVVVERRSSPVRTGQDRRSMSGAGGARRTSVFPRRDGAGPTFDAVAGDSLLVASATASTAQPRASRPPLTSSLGDAVLGAANAGAARSRPPRAQQLGLRGGVGRRLGAEPRQHGAAQEAPLLADLAARQLAGVGQCAHGLRLGLQKLGRLLDGQHLRRGSGHELGTAHHPLGIGRQRPREGGRRGAVPEDVGVVEALGHEPAHDVALGQPPLEGEAVELLGLLEGEPDEEGRRLVVAALALLGHARMIAQGYLDIQAATETSSALYVAVIQVTLRSPCPCASSSPKTSPGSPRRLRAAFAATDLLSTSRSTAIRRSGARPSSTTTSSSSIATCPTSMATRSAVSSWAPSARRGSSCSRPPPTSERASRGSTSAPTTT